MILLHGMMRRMMPAAVLLFILLLPQGGRAAQPGGKAAVAVPQAVVEARLLLDQAYITALLNGIDHAKAEIFLSVYLFRTVQNARGYPEAVLENLVEAARRGVRVEAVLERGQDLDDLNRNNAETAERLRQGGIRVCLDGPDRQMHTKLIVIDRRYVLIGSHNLTQSALKFNHEASVWIDSASLAEEALRYMESLCPGDWN